MASKLSCDFYRQPTLDVAKTLIGKKFVHRNSKGKLSGRIVEVEAYIGEDDPACHARFGMTGRNSVMYGDGGHLYVYFIYGMYNMLNFVTEDEGVPAAVLIRAIEPLEGISEMQANRACIDERQLCSGPGKLCQAFGVKVSDTGKSLTGAEFSVVDDGIQPGQIVARTRIGIRQGRDLLWRFYDSESKFVSRK
ncbi:MAG: DNA-3-methyladenine glycosylase [bacterium]|nr:DNA-3-methyladenine glycosylase [bacterium]